MIAGLLEEASKISFQEEITRYGISGYAKDALADLRVGQYYFLLAAAAKLLQSKNALDLGTLQGGSAIALAKYAEKVTTVDNQWHQLSPGLFPPSDQPRVRFRDNMKALLVESSETYELPFPDYDLIFVDLDPHDGLQEKIIHERLVGRYSGYVFYDDVDQPQMRRFWEPIPQEKTEFSRGSIGRIGLVRYGAGVDRT